MLCIVDEPNPKQHWRWTLRPFGLLCIAAAHCCWMSRRLNHESLTCRPRYFIYRGSVEVVNDNGTVVFATMKEGEFFGEISLVFSCPRTASIRTATHCDLIVLAKSDLDHVLRYFPEISRQVRQEAEQRFNKVKERAKQVSIAHVVAPRPLVPVIPQPAPGASPVEFFFDFPRSSPLF